MSSFLYGENLDWISRKTPNKLRYRIKSTIHIRQKNCCADCNKTCKNLTRHIISRFSNNLVTKRKLKYQKELNNFPKVNNIPFLRSSELKTTYMYFDTR